jgi:hypothetical protein
VTLPHYALVKASFMSLKGFIENLYKEGSINPYIVGKITKKINWKYESISCDKPFLVPDLVIYHSMRQRVA